MEPIVIVIYALACVPGIICCFVPDIGPPGAVVVLGLGLVFAPWVSMAVIVAAVVVAVWFFAALIYQAGGGRL